VDIRLPVGAIFTVYGAILTVYGLASGDLDAHHMIAGLNVNIVAGAGMLVFGLAMLYLARRAPRLPQSTAGEEPPRRHVH
jgi:hypothetical protein